jgi:hypothetical protein
LGVYLEHVDHDELFANSPVSPIIINDIPTVTEEQKEYLNGLIYKRFESDLLSNEPSCECGATTGGYKLGVICPNCNTTVRDEMDQELHPLVWIRTPVGVKKLINPIILMKLLKHFNKGNFSLVEWLINTDYTSTGQRPAYLDSLIAMGMKRGYNNFITHIEEYLTMMFDIKTFRSKKGQFDALYHLVMKDLKEGKLLSHYVPLINRSLLVIEETNVGKWVDPIVMGAIDAIRTITSIDDVVMGYTPRQKENRTAKTLIALSQYYKDTIDMVLSDKPGLFRKHVFACRNHFSMRNVISSLTKAHQYDELHIPWGAAVTIFKLHLMNKLLKRGYTINNATALLHRCVYEFHPLIRQLFDELFAESRDGCHYAQFQRNPSLTRASAQRMRITRVKDDPNDPTIALSILATKG